MCQMQGISRFCRNANLANLVSSFPLECSGIEEVSVKQIGLLYFGFPGGHQPQTPILSKPLLPHQERLRRTFCSGRLLMTLLQFGPQWDQMVDLTAHYLLQSFLMTRLLSSVIPKTRKTLCERFQLAFKTAI